VRITSEGGPHEFRFHPDALQKPNAACRIARYAASLAMPSETDVRHNRCPEGYHKTDRKEPWSSSEFPFAIWPRLVAEDENDLKTGGMFLLIPKKRPVYPPSREPGEAACPLISREHDARFSVSRSRLRRRTPWRARFRLRNSSIPCPSQA